MEKYHHEWQKIDFENMARVDRAIAAALVMIANSDSEPHWSEANGPGKGLKQPSTSKSSAAASR